MVGFKSGSFYGWPSWTDDQHQCVHEEKNPPPPKKNEIDAVYDSTVVAKFCLTIFQDIYLEVVVLHET